MSVAQLIELMGPKHVLHPDYVNDSKIGPIQMDNVARKNHPCLEDVGSAGVLSSVIRLLVGH